MNECDNTCLCLVRSIELYNPHTKSTIEYGYGTEAEFKSIECWLDTNFRSDCKKLYTYKFKNKENTYVYRIPFTCVYIDKNLRMWARKEDIVNNNLLSVPTLNHDTCEVKMINLDKSMLKSTTVYNATDNFLNIGFTSEQLYHIAKYCKIEEYFDAIIDFVRDDVSDVVEDVYDRDIGYTDIEIEELANAVKKDIVIEDNISYLKKSLYTSVHGDDKSVEFHFVGNENFGDKPNLISGSNIVISHGDGKYTLYNASSNLDNNRIVEDYDINTGKGDLDLAYNLFRTIVPGWEPGKEYENLFCNKLPDNINKIIWK